MGVAVGCFEGEDGVRLTGDGPGLEAAFVDHAVVSPAEEEQVGDVGFAAVYPVHVVVDLGVPVGEVASGESAGFVAFADGFGCWCGYCSGESAYVEGFGDSSGDDPTDFGVTTDT